MVAAVVSAPIALTVKEPEVELLTVTAAVLASNRLTPSNFAPRRAELISVTIASKSALSLVKVSLAAGASAMATARLLSSVRALVMVSPAAMATSTIDWPRCMDCLTESRADISARWAEAMAKMAPLSLADEIFRPVFTRL